MRFDLKEMKDIRDIVIRVRSEGWEGFQGYPTVEVSLAELRRA